MARPSSEACGKRRRTLRRLNDVGHSIGNWVRCTKKGGRSYFFMMTDEVLRLQFGTAATTIGTQWLALEQANGVAQRPHVLAFEAKGRVMRPTRGPPKQQEDPSTWGGSVQVYDQSRGEPLRSQNDGLWSWSGLDERNLVEIDEFRPHLPLHNFYEGHSTAHGGSISSSTLEMAKDRVRTVLEACDQLRVVQNLVDMDSSWGGLANEIMTHILDECPGAVTMFIGNDWDPSPSLDDEDAVYPLASIRRDRTKLLARKQLNVASAMAILSEVSHLTVPVAMSSTTLLTTTLPHISFDRTSCADVSTVIATALEFAVSALQDRPAHNILGDFYQSMNVIELAAVFPYTADPILFLQDIGKYDTAQGNCHMLPQDPFRNCSLLPSLRHATLDITRPDRSFFRKMHFRGSFIGYSSLQQSIDSFPGDIAMRWSASPLVLPPSYRLSTLRSSSIAGISQLSSCREIGHYLSTLGHQAATSNKRVWHEFTQAGMSSDAPEELKSILATEAAQYLMY